MESEMFGPLFYWMISSSGFIKCVYGFSEENHHIMVSSGNFAGMNIHCLSFQIWQDFPNQKKANLFNLMPRIFFQGLWKGKCSKHLT